MSEPALVRLLVNHHASEPAFQRAVSAAQVIIPHNFTYLGTTFTVAAHHAIVLVTTTLQSLEATLPSAFIDGDVSLLQVDIVGPVDTRRLAKPGWYQETGDAFLNMFFDPEGIRTGGMPYIHCTGTGGDNSVYELTVTFYRAVLSGTKSPTQPF